jgi:hypothetical protein
VTTSLDFKLTEDQYWEAVRLCLRRFHGYNERSSKARLDEFLAWLRQQDREAQILATHPEPFYSACDLAGRDIEIEGRDKEYAEVLEEASPHLESVP